MSKIKANQICNVAETHCVDVSALGGYPLSSAWDGLVLDETTVPKLSEVGIIGTTPEAKLYPDGSIVGSSDNGQFVKYANGQFTQILKLYTETGVADATTGYTKPFVLDIAPEFFALLGSSIMVSMIDSWAGIISSNTAMHAGSQNSIAAYVCVGSTIQDFDMIMSVWGRWK